VGKRGGQVFILDRILWRVKNEDLTLMPYFGKPRKSASSHRIYRTPWRGDPRINIQNYKGKAKAYQVKQVLLALEKLEVGHGIKK
jgi:hypothetical protein